MTSHNNGKTKILLILLAVSIMIILFLAVKLIEKGNVPASTATTTTTQVIASGEAAAKQGDVVEVDYTGRYKNGTMFDTSVESVAMAAGKYDSVRSYTPIVFTIGLGKVVTGVEEAVVGMKVGEEKTVTLSPEKAYGDWSQDNLEKVDRIQVMSRIENVSQDLFEQAMGENAVVNKVFNTSEMPWPIEVIKVENNTVHIRHNPINGTVLPTMLGNSTITADRESIYSRLDAKQGDIVMTQIGYVKIARIDDTTVTLDANNLLAGQTIIFELKLISINQATDTLQNQPAY